MLRLPTPYFEGVTREDMISLRSLLEGRTLAPDLLERLHLKGWVDPCPQGYLLTWAGRCVVEIPVPE